MRNKIDLCKDLEPTPSGRALVHKITQQTVGNVFDLIDKYNCPNCDDRYNCNKLQILEANICL